jgi:hypothetical protein
MSIDRNLVLRCALESGFVLSTFNGGATKKLAPMADVDSLCRLIKAYEAARAAPAVQPDECSDALAVLQHAYDYCQKRDLSDGKYIERAIYTAMSRLRDWYRGCASAFQADENGFESLVTLQIASPAPPKQPSPIGINEADGERE